MTMPVSKLALVWDELRKLSKEDDLDSGDLRWCDFLFAHEAHIKLDYDAQVNCADDCPGFEGDNCFLK